MKALLLRDYNRLEYCDLPDPTPADDEVLIRVRACGICGSDVHGIDGSTGRRIPPLVMGHEAAGEVAAVGRSVTNFQVGQAVTFDSTVWCGRCRFCRQGKINLCDARQVLGVACEEFRRDGAFAEYVAVPERIVVPVPDGLSYVEAAMAEPLSVAVHAVNQIPQLIGKTAAVVGTGVVGLFVIQVLKVAGCSQIFAVDRDQYRLKLATELGATYAFAVDDRQNMTDIVAKIVDLTGGGTDCVVEAVGVADTVDGALRLVRKGGTVVLVGNLRPDVSFPLQHVVTREIKVLGSCASCGEYSIAVDLLARRKVAASPLISAVAPLAEGPAWFARLRSGEGRLIKVVLEP